MSEQVKRWPMWRAIEELGPDDWVVRDTCYDTLAQRCRELGAENAALSNRHVAAVELIEQVSTVRAEVANLKSQNEDLTFALSDAESRANNAGRNASAFEGCMGDLQVVNGKLLDEIADLKARLLEAERGNEELVRLRAECREAAKDAARLDWIAVHLEDIVICGIDPCDYVTEAEEGWPVLRRMATDAAMEAACATTDGATATP